MKTKIVSLLFGLFLTGTIASAQSPETSKFKVEGNCGMCELRIEKATMSVDGVSSADWDKETKMITVVFNPSKTDIHKIHKAIADAGHDTEMQKADDKVYNALPGCCKYR